MAIGRVLCVGLPVALTLASLICLLIGGLAGVSEKDLFAFRVNTTAVSINPSDIDISSIVSSVTSRSVAEDGSRMAARAVSASDVAADVKSAASSLLGSSGGNVTAADLGLNKLYDIGLWGYCYTPQSGARACTKPQFDWATKDMDKANNFIGALSTTLHVNLTIGHAEKGTIDAFCSLVKWSEIAFVVASVALAVQLALGVFAVCTRAVSCITWLVSIVVTVLVVIAAVLPTVLSVVAAEAIHALNHRYGIDANVNHSFLTVLWLAVVFEFASIALWLFSSCCCKPDHNRRSRRAARDSSAEKLIPTRGSQYQPLQNPALPVTAAGTGAAAYAHQHPEPQTGHAADYYRRDDDFSHGYVTDYPRQSAGEKYEPYSHQV